MRYPTDLSFCRNGILDPASSVVSILPGGAIPPRASVLKNTPRRFRKAFFAQSAAQKVTEVTNTSLSLTKGGGLTITETLPADVHTLLARFCYSDCHKNSVVSLTSQFISYAQNALSHLNGALLKYTSPVYNMCPLKVREFKNGRKEIIKNKDYPVYEKWDALISRIHFSPAYATTRLNLSLEGLLPPSREHLES
jgi:hypothetical protein